MAVNIRQEIGLLVVWLAVWLLSVVSSFRPAFVVPTKRVQGWKSVVTDPNKLFAMPPRDDEDDDDDDDDDEDDNTARYRKRDRLKDWMTSSSSSGPMVQPIGRQDDDDSVSDDSPRIRAKFDSLFAGMPSLGDILGAGEEAAAEAVDGGGGGATDKDVDDSWFEQEKQQIMDNYQHILDEMLLQLQEQQAQDPNAVPDNAQAMIKSVLKQEMDREIAATREARAQEMLQSYQEEQRSKMESQDLSVAAQDEDLQELMEQSEQEYQQKQAAQARLEEFLRYEEEAFRQATKESDRAISQPTENENLDRWALDRFEEMVRKRQDSDEDAEILDILEDNLEDLRNRMEKQLGQRETIKPETMKEWQMYRSIASRLIAEGDGNIKEGDLEGQILKQLESWKDYVQKEEGIRKDSGLSRGPRLPFEWQESTLDAPPADTSPPMDSLQSKVDARKEVNRMSLEALESLLETSDPQRRAKLEEEIKFLKATLESNDYLDVDEATLADNEVEQGPVDMSDVFASSGAESDGSTKRYEEPASYSVQSSQTPPTPFLDSSQQAPPEPNTPFFEDDSASEEKISAPSTPFFTESPESVTEETTLSGDSKLGSMDDQKLEAMFRRAGAQTPEERQKIRDQWEDFQEVERQKRELSGLSGGDDGEMLTQTELKYNVSDVIKGDGDIDAEKILATIGPRPTRSQPTSPTGGGTGDTDTQGIADDAFTDPRTDSSVDDEEVVNSLYRAASAVGGGRYKDDPDGDRQQKAAFEEYMRKEAEVRRSLDKDVDASAMDDAALSDASFDDVEYAEEVLSSMGPRPQPKRTRIIDEGEYSDRGGILSSEDDDDTDDDGNGDEEEEPATMEPEAMQPDMPEWLRRETEEARGGQPTSRKSFPGSDIDEVFDDTDYDKQMRQVHEFEQRRAGRERQMGIDISDVLGRESDDYADYKFDDEYFRGRQDNWGSASFQTRKANYLDYTELEVAELNALMDHKDSVYSTGVSQYMPRINKPFKEFGAIFRLEGVLLDITGLQQQAWTQVAEEYGYQVPTVEDIRRAAVIHPLIAVKDVFFWSDDIFQCRKVATSHRKVFRQVFETWKEEVGIETPEETDDQPAAVKGSFAIEQDLVDVAPVPRQQKSEEERIRSASVAWAKSAEKYGKIPPTEEQVLKAFLVSPEIAILEVFQWTDDPKVADIIAQSYEDYFVDPTGATERRRSEDTSSRTDQTSASGSRSQNDVMEMHFKAWTRVAQEFGFDEPLPEEVMAAFVINDPLIAIRDGFGWTEDQQQLTDAVNVFSESIAELGGEPSTPRSAVRKEVPDTTEQGQPLPNADQVFHASFDAWTAVAKRAKLDLPDYDQVQFAFTVGPEEAIVTGFQWTDDESEAEKLVESYRSELAQRRASWSSNNETSSTASTKAPSKKTLVPEPKGGPSADEVYKAAFDAWTATATQCGYAAPDAEAVQFALVVGPEEAIVTGFQWTEDEAEVSKVVVVYKQELSKRRSNWQSDSTQETDSAKSGEETIPPFVVMPGAADWIKSLLAVEMQCGIISYLDRDQVDVLLEQAGLADLFPRDQRVSANNGYSRDSQQMLGAALRLERRPDHCVVFDTTPYSSVGAREADMKSVSLIGPYPRYELLTADTTSNSFDDLTAMNIRRLFGERIFDQPMLDTQDAEPDKRRETKTKFFWDDE